MQLIKTIVKQSDIEGLGVFADQDIPKGTITWRFNPKLDLTLSREEVEKLPEPAKSYILHFGYLAVDTDQYILPFDNDRFSNHSDNPNTEVSDTIQDFGEYAMVASRDIKKGEEITVNYEDIDQDIERKGVR